MFQVRTFLGVYEYLEEIKNARGIDSGVAGGGANPHPEVSPSKPANQLAYVAVRPAASGQNQSGGTSNGGRATAEVRTSHCWRRCPQRINIIYFQDYWGGINDRHSILQDLAQLAGYLCARLELPPPSILLDPGHNNGVPISRKAQWQDFRNLTFLQDGSSVISLNPSFGSVVSEEWPVYKGERYGSWMKIVPDGHLSKIYNSNEFSDWLHIVSNAAQMTDHFDYIQDFSWVTEKNTNSGFVWEIRRQTYLSDLHVLPGSLPKPSNETKTKYNYSDGMLPSFGNKKGCGYINSDHEPLLMKELRNRLKEKVMQLSPQNNSVFGHLHLRRGDAIQECNTSMDAVRSFLNCSLNGTEATGKQVVILLGSDEKNMTYRHSVLNLAANFPHVSILDGDKLVKEVFHEAIKGENGVNVLDNNYYFYELQNSLVSGDHFITFKLEKNRRACPECKHILI